jgi:hypothetical protein
MVMDDGMVEFVGGGKVPRSDVEAVLEWWKYGGSLFGIAERVVAALPPLRRQWTAAEIAAWDTAHKIMVKNSPNRDEEWRQAWLDALVAAGFDITLRDKP